MSLPDPSLGPLKRKDGQPVFDEPWQAQALAMADLLVKSGTVSSSKWAETLGAELRAAILAGRPDDTGTYYGAVLSAIERILDSGQIVSREEVTQRRDEWERAYVRTPHGHPVELDRGRLP